MNRFSKESSRNHALAPSAAPGRSALTKGEHVVAVLAARGLSNDQIARERGCSSRTVANQLASVYRKLRLSGRRELRAWSLASAPNEARRLHRELDESRLTARERQVLAYVELGHSNKLIAATLGLAVSTISSLLSKARRKRAGDLDFNRAATSPG